MAEQICVLAVDAEHPDERPVNEPSDAFYRSALQFPRQGIASIIGNLDAYNQGVRSEGKYPRYMDENYTQCRPDPVGNREQRRKHHVETAIYPKFDVIVARHGNPQFGGEFGFCRKAADPIVLEIMAFLGIKRLVHPEFSKAWHPTPRKYAGIDLSPDSVRLATDGLRERLALFAKGDRSDTSGRSGQFEHYAEIGDLTMHRAQAYDLPETWEPFRPMGRRIARKLNYPDDSVFMMGSATLYGDFYGQVAIPI